MHVPTGADLASRAWHPRRNRFVTARVIRAYCALMGRIEYDGGGSHIPIEDRALAHLKVVVATKLRRNESFTLSWKHGEGDEPGRSTIWLHPSIPIRFVFEESDPPELNRNWIERLMHSANSSGGITLVDEIEAMDESAAAEETGAAESTGEGEA